MKRTFRVICLTLALTLAGLFFLPACNLPVPSGYRTYSLPDKGIAHLSLEYPAAFNVRQVQLYDETGYERIDIDGPYSRQNRDRTTMWVVAQRFTTPVTIGNLIQSSMGVAGGLSGYRLIDRSTISVDGITAEQYIYFYYSQRSAYEINILGFKPAPMVTREIFFTFSGLQWTVAMSADESTVDADTVGFEQLLQTLTMLP
jgi:hypothetical protein